MTSKQQICNTAWKVADTLRGTIGAGDYKDYILTLLFLKYISDVYKEHYEAYLKKYDGDESRIQRALKRDRFILKEESTFDYIYKNKNEKNIGEILNTALRNIEEENSSKLRGVFRNIDFNSEVVFGESKEKNAILKTMLEDYRELDLRPTELEDNDVIGDAYEYLIGEFASDAGKKGGEFFTPPAVSTLLSKLVKPKVNERIYDPTCGSGSLLIKASNEVPEGKIQIYGQEKNGQTHALCKMNMFLHDIDDAKIEWGDTLSNPKHLENDNLMKFQVIVANPPFSLDKWAKGFSGTEVEDKKFKMESNLDIYNRFDWGVPPSSKGDYAFIQHMINSLTEEGRMAVVLPHGVLFRGASEAKIRKKLIELNYLDAVIGIPENLFFGTGIAAVVLIFKKNRVKKDVLFIDASGEGNYEKAKNQNILREEDVKKIVDTYENYKTVEKYSYLASIDDIKENGFNLNIPRYVDTFEEEEAIDINDIRVRVNELEKELKNVQSKMDEYLKQLGI